jgi:hypothetical protein
MGEIFVKNIKIIKIKNSSDGQSRPISEKTRVKTIMLVSRVKRNTVLTTKCVRG